MTVKELKECLVDEVNVALTAPNENTRNLEAATLKEIQPYDEEDIDHIAISRDKKECVLSIGLTRAIIVRWTSLNDFKICGYFETLNESTWVDSINSLGRMFSLKKADNICRELKESDNNYRYMVLQWVPGLQSSDIRRAIEHYVLKEQKPNNNRLIDKDYFVTGMVYPIAYSSDKIYYINKKMELLDHIDDSVIPWTNTLSVSVLYGKMKKHPNYKLILVEADPHENKDDLKITVESIVEKARKKENGPVQRFLNHLDMITDALISNKDSKDEEQKRIKPNILEDNIMYVTINKRKEDLILDTLEPTNEPIYAIVYPKKNSVVFIDTDAGIINVDNLNENVKIKGYTLEGMREAIKENKTEQQGKGIRLVIGSSLKLNIEMLKETAALAYEDEEQKRPSAAEELSRLLDK